MIIHSWLISDHFLCLFFAFKKRIFAAPLYDIICNLVEVQVDITGFGQQPHTSGVVRELDEDVVGEGWHAVVCVQGE